MTRILLVLALVATSCSGNNGNNDPTLGSSDAATQSDSGGQADSGPTGDSGGVSDSGNAVDTGSSDSGTATDSGPNDTGTGDVGVDMPPPISPCPDTLPQFSTACADEGLVCEYGDDPRDGCRARGVCTSGEWQVTTPRCTAIPDATCPASRDDASGQLCEPLDGYCDYDGLVCHCTNCVEYPVQRCEGDVVWMCDIPNTEPGCPTAKPRLGDACAAEGTQCKYECGTEGARVCTNSAWQAAEGDPCPRSSALLKRDIRYLSSAQLSEVSEAVQAIRLSNYYYKDPSIGRGQKLGFIIEDMPVTSPAVDRQRMMADLYGYTSMLVADAQVREKRMQQLEARLDELERKAAQCGD